MKICPTCQLEYADDVDFCPADGMKLRVRRETSADPLLGRALDGRWIIEEKLGEGGMGAVYRGHQRSVNRTVAIKTLRPQLVESDEFVNRFFREAQIAANIAHPHCVTILDYGEDDGTLYLAMEFLEGTLLSDRIETGGLTAKEVIEIGIQTASALSAAHDQNIVHRDLKPDNIYLLDVPGGGTFVKVLDFGIAKMLDSTTQVTKTGMLFGTPEYMSPEQCRGDRIDGRSDLYSLGCILYELIGGRTPFRSTTPMAVLMAHVHQEAPALRGEGAPGSRVPPGLDAIVMQLLAKTPEGRFATATALREALEAELQRLENPSATLHAPQHAIAPEVNIAFNSTVALEAPVEGAAMPTGAVGYGRDDDDALEPAARKSRVGLAVIASVLVLASLAAAVFVAVSLPDSDTVEAAVVKPAPVVASPPAVAEPQVELAETEAAREARERLEEERRKAEEQLAREQERLQKAQEKERKAERKAQKRREKQRKKEQRRRSEVESPKPAEPEPVVAEKPAERPSEPAKKTPDEPATPEKADKTPKDKLAGEVKERLDKGAKGLSKILEDKMDDLLKE